MNGNGVVLEAVHLVRPISAELHEDQHLHFCQDRENHQLVVVASLMQVLEAAVLVVGSVVAVQRTEIIDVKNEAEVVSEINCKLS